MPPHSPIEIVKQRRALCLLLAATIAAHMSAQTPASPGKFTETSAAANLHFQAVASHYHPQISP